jgi:heme/copper-type cytochrome/quinol oxidase subunit 4
LPRKHQNTSKEEKTVNKMASYAIWALYALIILSVLAYAAYNVPAIGALAVILIIITLIAEFRLSIKEEGTKKSIYEVIVALVTVVVGWLIISAILQTSSPINVVASCSMLPNLHRGDMVFLHGITNMSQFLSSNHVPIVNLSGSQFTSYANISTMWRVYLPYYDDKTSLLNSFGANPFSPFIPSGSNYKIGLYDLKCIDYYVSKGIYYDSSKCYVDQTDQKDSLVQYNYSIERLSASNGTNTSVVVTSELKIDGTVIKENYSNPIIVYATVPNDSYPQSDVVHRLVAAVKDDGHYYLLTKGDNNPYLDLQVVNYPVNQSSTVGYVIGSVPVLGYIKILLSGQISSVAGCNETIIR